MILYLNKSRLIRSLFVLLPIYSIAQQNKLDNSIKKNYQFSTKPTWADEFDKDGLPDTTKWSYELGDNGWGNHELEYYTKGKNAIVSNGVLHIVARKQNVGKAQYTSTRMVTKNKANFLYGRFEIKAKLPTGAGLWPAIWMMPVKEIYGGWPASGEIDIMEQVGFDPDSIHISTHTKELNWIKGNGITKVVKVNTATSYFHIYRIDWTPASVLGFIDGKQVFEHPNDGKGSGYYPFNQPFFIILNIAIGGDWGGKKGIDNTIFPATMDVDYVRVYELKK